MKFIPPMVIFIESLERFKQSPLPSSCFIFNVPCVHESQKYMTLIFTFFYLLVFRSYLLFFSFFGDLALFVPPLCLQLNHIIFGSSTLQLSGYHQLFVHWLQGLHVQRNCLENLCKSFNHLYRDLVPFHSFLMSGSLQRKGSY